jgi:hypothetical protein
MTTGDRYLVVGLEGFRRDLHFLRQQAKASPGGYLQLYRATLREIERLRSGKSDGHHALGYESGKGDLRDCVTAYVRSDPARKADFRLVFREIGADQPGGLPRRELVAIKPRRGRNNIYAHACARLNRHPSDRQPGLNRFGDRRPDARGSRAARQAELDAKRAIAHAWEGQQPLRSSRPLAVGRSAAGPPRGVEAGMAARRTTADGLNGQVAKAGVTADPGPSGDSSSTGYPRARQVRPAATGWPAREQ